MENLKTLLPLPARTRRATKQLRTETFGLVTSDGTIVESLYNPDKTPACMFVVKKPLERAEVLSSFDEKGITNYPPDRLIAEFDRRRIFLPSGPSEYGTVLDLLEQLKKHIGEFINLPDFEISLIAHYILMSYVYDAWNSFPYLRFKGEPGTGKTRCLEVIKQLSYRCTDMGVSPSKSVLFRRIDQTRGTLILDEADFDGDLQCEMNQILNAGYRLDGVVQRSKATDDDFTPEAFSVGCPKVIANRLEFKDRALESRCLTIYTVSKSSKGFPTALPKDFADRSRLLRNQLLKFRLDTFHSLERDESKLNHLDGRAKELGLPIYSVSPDSDFKQDFLSFLSNRSRLLREYDPLCIVLEVLEKLCVPEDCFSYVGFRQLSEQAIVIANGRDMPPSEFSPRRIGELLRNLGFKAKRKNNGREACIPASLLAELLTRHNVNVIGNEDYE